MNSKIEQEVTKKMDTSKRTKYVVTGGCTLCTTCVYECPRVAITMTSKGAVIDQEKCTGCGKCYDNCASEAIRKIDQ